MARWKLALLDRDGVINRNQPIGVFKVEELRLLRKSAEAIRLLNESNIPVALVTNQGAIARGQATLEQFHRVQAALSKKLKRNRARLDHVLFCPDGPTSPRFKPAPGMVLEALTLFSVAPEHALMVGDSITDLEAAHAAGIASVFVHKETQEEPSLPSSCLGVCPSLWHAVRTFFL